MSAALENLTLSKGVFLLLMAFHSIWQSLFAIQLLFTPETVLQRSAIPLDFLANLSGLLVLSAAGQILLVALSVLAIVWSLGDSAHGFLLGILLGVYFLALGIALWFGNGEPSLFSTIDVLRGIMSILSGSLAWRGASE